MTGAGTREGADLVLVPDATAPGRARAFVAQHCRRAGLDQDTRDTVLLVVSEVVTNAVLHGRSEVLLRIRTSARGVHVEVADDNSRHPTRVELDTDALDGRGMAIVELCAAAWGVTDTPTGKVVWFDVRAP